MIAMTRPIKNLSMIFLLMLPFNLSAAKVGYTAGVAFASYDNVDLVPVPVSGETSIALNGGISVLEDNAEFYTNIAASIRSINYKNDIIPDENIGGLNANIIWRIMPGRFEWFLDDIFTQTAIDTQASNTPTNRQNINVFSTGPNYNIRINARNSISLEARAESFTYEENLDNNRATLAARWQFRFNSALTVAINDEAETTRFKDTIVNADFNRNDVFLSFDYIKGVNTFSAEYGSTLIVNDNIADIDEGRYLFSFTNARTRTSLLRFFYENVTSDTGRQITGSALSDSVDDSTNNTAANDVFTNELLSLQYIKTLSSSTVTFQLDGLERDYKRQDNLDVINLSAFIRGRWVLKGRNYITYSLSYTNSEYQDPAENREDDDYLYSISYTHSLRRNMNVALDVLSLERVSTVESENYEDLRFIISLNYTLL